MQFSMATANLYYHPFEQTLEVIAEAGFQNIELDLYWERKEWAMAQHLRGMPVKQVIHLVQQSGLRISSIHDGGGVLENAHSTLGFINPVLEQYLEAMGYAPDCLVFHTRSGRPTHPQCKRMGYAPDCLVFHTPHVEGDPDAGWWERTCGEVARALEKYRQAGALVTIENMPFFDGYFVPLTTPEELNAYVAEHGLHATLDTTHYAQIGTDIVEAARKLQPTIKTIHLSDFKAGRSHVFIGEGELDLPGFFEALDKESLNAVTLECSLSSPGHPAQEMSRHELVDRIRAARERLEAYLFIPTD